MKKSIINCDTHIMLEKGDAGTHIKSWDGALHLRSTCEVAVYVTLHYTAPGISSVDEVRIEIIPGDDIVLPKRLDFSEEMVVKFGSKYVENYVQGLVHMCRYNRPKVEVPKVIRIAYTLKINTAEIVAIGIEHGRIDFEHEELYTVTCLWTDPNVVESFCFVPCTIGKEEFAEHSAQCKAALIEAYMEYVADITNKVHKCQEALSALDDVPYTTSGCVIESREG